MPTQLNYVKGKWLDREEELLLRRAELLAEKKDVVAATDDFAARFGHTTNASSKCSNVAAHIQISPDLLKAAAGGLLSLGGDDVEVNAATPSNEGEQSKVASKNKTKKRQQLSPEERGGEKKKKTYKYIKLCRVEGCTKQVQKGGVCITHGAQLKRCSSEGCPNRAVKGGVCKRHGAVVERKRCSAEDCTSLAQKGGMCHRHGAKRTVIADGGSKGKPRPKKQPPVSKKGEGKVKHLLLCAPVVVSPAAEQPSKRKRCTVEGCNNQAKQGGECAVDTMHKKLYTHDAVLRKLSQVYAEE